MRYANNETTRQDKNKNQKTKTTINYDQNSKSILKKNT